MIGQVTALCCTPVQEHGLNSWERSDHRIITVITSIMKSSLDEKSASRQNFDCNMLHLLSSMTNWLFIKHEMSQVCWHLLDDVHQPGTHYEELSRVCLNICTRHSPTRRQNTKTSNKRRKNRLLMTWFSSKRLKITTENNERLRGETEKNGPRIKRFWTTRLTTDGEDYCGDNQI